MKELLHREFRDIFKASVLKRFGKLDSEKIDQMIEQMEYEFDLYDNNIEETHKKTLSKLKKLKRSWCKRYLEGKNHKIDIDSVALKEEEMENGVLSQESFYNFYKVYSLAEYIDYKEKKLVKWRDNSEVALVDFPYFYHLSTKFKKTAIRYMGLLQYYDFINLKQGKGDDILRIPRFMDILPINVSRKNRIGDSARWPEIKKNVLNSEEKLVKMFDINNEEMQEIKERLVVQLEKDAYIRLKAKQSVQDIFTQLAIIKATRDMNSYDSAILSYIYTRFCNSILSESIKMSVYEIIHDLGLKETGKVYENVRDSILKLSKLNIEYSFEDCHLSGSLFDIFMESKTAIDNNKGRMSIELGPFFKKMIYMREEFNFDKNGYNNLDLYSQRYAIWFQKRRLYKCADCLVEEDLSILVVVKSIVWGIKRTDRVIERILNSLEQLKENRLIIKDYSYDKKSYMLHIEYVELPLEIQEKIRTNDFKTGELIEGSIVGK